MPHSQTLTRHKDIQNWVANRRGLPGIAHNRNRFGGLEPRLRLRFRNRGPSLGVDDGVSPCSWTAWLAELDRQQLALRVADSEEPDFELVPRSQMN